MAKVMRYGASTYMKLRDPSPSEAKVELPSWAAQQVADVAREIVAGIRGLGVRVVGDLDSLVPGARRLEPGRWQPMDHARGGRRNDRRRAARQRGAIGQGNPRRSTGMTAAASDELAAGPIADRVERPAGAVPRIDEQDPVRLRATGADGRACVVGIRPQTVAAPLSLRSAGQQPRRASLEAPCGPAARRHRRQDVVVSTTTSASSGIS